MLCYTSWTALLEAGYYGHEAVVQARLAIVANVDHAGVADETSLSLARGQGNPGSSLCLLQGAR
jgi:ankyrin repeat protein